ncbi:MAG: c-type cytochrome biogenesis protein CcmI [Casimicrobiaceae bacterium]
MPVLFWILGGVLLALAVTLLTLPLWRKPAADEADEADASVDALNVLRDQKRELDREVDEERITAAEREQRIAELSRRVIEEDLANGKEAVVRAPRSRRGLAIGLAVLIPLIAVPLYLTVGTPAALDPVARAASEAAANADAHANISPEQFNAMLAELRKKLEASPNDATGWRMLGRGLRIGNDLAGSADAYGKAAALQPDDAAVLVDYADALAMLRDRDMSGKPWELVQRALKLNPQLPKALAMAGAAELAQGHHDSARDYWQRLLAVLPADAPEASELRNLIAQIDNRGTGAKATSAETSPSSATPSPAPSAGAIAGDKAVSGTVSVVPAFAAQLKPDDTLFIFARATQGPRMPVAILRRKVSDLPFKFRLDDTQAMAGGPVLSSISQVRIEARISKSGEALPRPGDLRGESQLVAPGTPNLSIVIDQVIH